MRHSYKAPTAACSIEHLPDSSIFKAQVSAPSQREHVQSNVKENVMKSCTINVVRTSCRPKMVIRMNKTS